jgi:hypothetical protein
MGNKNTERYAYANIMNAYVSALENAANKIGLDSHGITLQTKSLDSKIINDEINKIHVAGREFVSHAVNHVTQTNNTLLDEIEKYVANMERPPLVNKYYNDEGICKDPEVLELTPHVILSDLHNAFNHGIFQNYKFLVQGDNKNSLYNMHGSKKVKINFKIPEK